jgi:DNA-binding transcriptional ArsR family regulator
MKGKIMDLIVHSGKDLVLEAASYLNQLDGETTVENVLNRLEILYAETGSDSFFKQHAEPLSSLISLIARQYTPDAREWDRFFKPFSVGQGNLAQVLIYSFYDPSIVNWEDQTANIAEKFAELSTDPHASLQQLSLGQLMNDSDSDVKEEQRPIVDQLEETDLADAEKWQVLRVIQDARPFLNQLTACLQPVKTLIEANLSIVTPILEDFAIRWRSYFDIVPFETFLCENMGVEAGDLSGYRLHIYPSIIDCGAIRLSIESTAKAIYAQIGICLKEGISVKTLPAESYRLLEGLKALSDKSKLAILASIRDKRSYGQALAKETGLSTATISHHMSALINCGFIHMERVENRIYYQMDKESLSGFLKKLTIYLLNGGA